MKCMILIVLVCAAALYANPVPGRIGDVGVNIGQDLSKVGGALGTGVGAIGGAGQAVAEGILGAGAGLVHDLAPSILGGLQQGLGIFSGLG